MTERKTAIRAKGWHPRTPLQNPRPPAVPASLDLTLAEYFAAAGLIGIISAQLYEPDPEWACEWALDVGAMMARGARRRRLNVVARKRRARR